MLQKLSILFVFLLGLFFAPACIGQGKEKSQKKKTPKSNCCKERDLLLQQIKALQRENDSLFKVLGSHKSIPLGENLELGKEIPAFIEKADSVLAFRIEPFEVEKPTGINEIEKHKIAKRTGKLTPDQAKKLQTIILDKQSYEGPITSCLFVPPVAFSFCKGKEKVNLLICFSCDEWVFYTKEKRISLSSFAARKALLAVIKPLFPEDKTIQGL